jgi:hypothetical protein
MRAVVVYESMFGNTRAIAEAIGEGLRTAGDVEVVRSSDANGKSVEAADLVVVGGPTHAWGMARPTTRKSAPNYAAKPGSDLTLEPSAEAGPGVREWMATLGDLHIRAAAFDTRMKAPAILTGRASRKIARALSTHGLNSVTRPASFLVTKAGHLLPGETDRARAWGMQLAALPTAHQNFR